MVFHIRIACGSTADDCVDAHLECHLALVSQWLCHANLETTLIYAHADTEMKRRLRKPPPESVRLTQAKVIPILSMMIL